MRDTVLALDVGVSGCSGDMIVSALAGLFANHEKTSVEEQIKYLVNTIEEKVGIHFTPIITEKSKDPIYGYNVRIEEEKTSISVKELREGLSILGETLTDKRCREGVVSCFDLLVEGEKKVHRSESVHLHEIGTYDTMFDIFGTLYFIDKLHVNWVNISPVKTGSGGVQTSHGLLPIPAPVTSWILRSKMIRVLDDGTTGELLTPTGAAIIATLQDYFRRNTQVFWKDEAYGFGTKEFQKRANALRARTGVCAETETEIIILETNVDDVTGEYLGYLSEKLMETGALDVSFTPLLMKKGRPGWEIKVICKEGKEDDLSKLIMRHTGTLGVRITKTNRHIGYRAHVSSVRYKEKEIRIKKGEYSHKLEFEDLKVISEETGLSPLEITNVLQSLKDYLDK